MQVIQVDESFAIELRHSPPLTKIYTSEGEFLGFFASAEEPNALQYVEAAISVNPEDFSSRRGNRGKVLTTEELIRHLESLEQ